MRLNVKTIISKYLYLLIFNLLLIFTVQAQDFIDFSAPPNPTGTIASGCPGASCEVNMPALTYNETYSFTVYLKSPFNYGMGVGDIEIDTVYTLSNCPELKENSIYIFDKLNGTIDITPNPYCIDDDTYLELRISANDHNGNIQYANFRFTFKRLPVKTVLVLDISGSMSTIEDVGDSRWEILKMSVEKFTTLYEFFKQDGDEIGITYFTHYLIDPDPPIGSGFTEITAWDAATATHDIINTDMNNKNPLAATAMGMGLFNAKTKLTASTDRYRKIAVLITDGLQNVPPYVNEMDGNSLTDGTTLNDYSTDNVDSIRYFTIATWGATAGVMPQVLANIAAHSNAHNLTQPNATGDVVQNYFFTDQTLKNILHGGSPQIVGKQIGNLASGSADHKFELNSNITKVAFIITHQEGDDLNISLYKDDLDITESATILDKTYFKLVGLEFPINDDNPANSEGKYTLNISGTAQSNYGVTCIVDDHNLNYECNLDKAIYKTGDTIQFIANLNYLGSSLNNPDDTVKVILLKPGDDINHLLATFETPDLTFNEEDPGTPEQQKLEYIYKNNPDFFDALLPQDQILDLTNQGNGSFIGDYYDTYVTGIYEAIFLIKAKDDQQGKFIRRDLRTTVFKYGKSEPVDIEIVTDNINPTAPSSLVATDTTQTTINLEWYSSTDISGIAFYHIYLNGDYLASNVNPNYQITDLVAGTSYNFYIIAEDAFGNLSDASTTISVSTKNESDETSPSIPSNIQVTNVAQTSIYLCWNPSTDENGIKEYVIFKNGEPYLNTTNTNQSIVNLSPNTGYTFYIKAIDNSENESEPSQSISLTTLGIIKDVTAPAKLIAENIALTTIDLAWEASNSNAGILEYNVYKNGSLIGSTSNINYHINNLLPSTEYKLHVIARDKNGNISDASNTITVETKSKSFGNHAILGLKIRPKNKYGYYLGPGFKSLIKVKYLPPKPRDPIAHKSNIQDEPTEDGNFIGEPFLKNIVDNLDGSYYLILANVPTNSNPSIEIIIDEEVVHSGPVYKIPVWFFIILIIILILVLVLRKQKKSTLYKLLWLILIILIFIWILHKTGQLFFLYTL